MIMVESWEMKVENMGLEWGFIHQRIFYPSVGLPSTNRSGLK
jgi:hypothetical protein